MSAWFDFAPSGDRSKVRPVSYPDFLPPRPGGGHCREDTTQIRARRPQEGRKRRKPWNRKGQPRKMPQRAVLGSPGGRGCFEERNASFREKAQDGLDSRKKFLLSFLFENFEGQGPEVFDPPGLVVALVVLTTENSPTPSAENSPTWFMVSPCVSESQPNRPQPVTAAFPWSRKVSRSR